MSTIKSKKAGPLKSFGTFALGVICFLGVRWLFFEPYVIPSGSMIPSLLIFDHILVNKFTFGIRYPFTQKWIVGPAVPKRGDVVVFQSVEEDIVMIKRVIGLPGDEVFVGADGMLKINGVALDTKKQSIAEVENNFPLHIECKDCDDFYLEDLTEKKHLMQLSQHDGRFSDGTYKVPEGNLFVMGDNRDRSRDSRYWGFLPLENLLGKAKWIWLSCDEAVSQTPVLCHPAYIRWQRLFYSIQ